MTLYLSLTNGQNISKERIERPMADLWPVPAVNSECKVKQFFPNYEIFRLIFAHKNN